MERSKPTFVTAASKKAQRFLTFQLVHEEWVAALDKMATKRSRLLDDRYEVRAVCEIAKANDRRGSIG